MYIIDIKTQVLRVRDLVLTIIPNVTGIRNQDKIKELFSTNTFEIEFTTHNSEFDITYTLTYKNNVATIKPKLGGVKKLVDYFAEAETLFMEMELEGANYNINYISNTELVYNNLVSSLLTIDVNKCTEVCKKSIKIQ